MDGISYTGELPDTHRVTGGTTIATTNDSHYKERINELIAICDEMEHDLRSVLSYEEPSDVQPEADTELMTDLNRVVYMYRRLKNRISV